MNEQSPDDPDARPDAADNSPVEEARLRAHWAGRTWRQSREGNWYLNAEGFNLVVSRRGGEWTVFIRNRETERGQVGRKTYPTLEAAKMAGVEALLWARRHL